MFRKILSRVGLTRFHSSDSVDTRSEQRGIREVLDSVSSLRNDVQELQQIIYLPSSSSLFISLSSKFYSLT